MLLRTVFALLYLTALAVAQDWELGGGVGYGVYRNGTVIAPGGQVTAGVRNRFAVAAWVTEDLHQYISGQFRYVYQDGDPFLQSGGVQTNLQGQSHTYTYDLLFHFARRATSIRPYVAAGLGAKQYVVTGPPNPSQPFTNIAVLNSTDEVKFVSALGGGVAFLLGAHVDVRVDFRDYITTFPKKIIVPVPLATGRGIIHQFTPLVGIGYRF